MEENILPEHFKSLSGGKRVSAPQVKLKTQSFITIIFVVFFLFFVFQNKCFSVSPWLSQNSIDQASLQLRDPPASASLMLGSKACAAIPCLNTQSDL